MTEYADCSYFVHVAEVTVDNSAVDLVAYYLVLLIRIQKPCTHIHVTEKERYVHCTQHATSRRPIHRRCQVMESFADQNFS